MLKCLRDNLWLIALSVVFVLAIYRVESVYAQYPNEVTADLVEVYNPNLDRELIGYGYLGEVYDKPATPFLYLTYSYTVDGTEYLYTTKSPYVGKSTIKLRYAEDPTVVIVSRKE